jgi:transposase
MDADGPAPKVLLADKGYDADFIREDMERRGGTAMIPTRRNRLIQWPVDAAIYALRNMVERWLASPPFGSTSSRMPGGSLPGTTRPRIATSAPSTSSQSDCGCANLSTLLRIFESLARISEGPCLERCHWGRCDLFELGDPFLDAAQVWYARMKSSLGGIAARFSVTFGPDEI